MDKGFLKNRIYEGKGSYIKYLAGLSVVLLSVLLFTTGCNSSSENAQAPVVPNPAAAEPQRFAGNEDTVKKEKPEKKETMGRMVSVDVAAAGRSDPFMPYEEFVAYENARNSAIAEANIHNANISRINKMKGVRIREEDDINRYGFDFPVPPTSLAGANSTALKITKTKVVGIMYNPESPSAIINVDKKDYLVRPGDKIIDEKYKVVKINPNWITVSMGANVYSAAIGESFTKEGIQTNQTDIYNLKNRFGGRKS